MNHILWLTYLSVLVFHFVRIECAFTPSARAGHSAVLYNESYVYFQGGAGSSPSTSSEFFYLNLSTAFDTTNKSSIPWVNLTSLPNQPSRSYAFSCVSGKSIFIFGDSDNTPPPVVQFDLISQSWKTPTINGLTTQSSSSVANQCLTLGDGIIYMYAGNNIIFFNTTSLNWNQIPSVVTTVRNKDNVILPNGTVVFVGGETVEGGAGLYLLYQAVWAYDTKSESWTRIETTNNHTSSCTPTASILAPDGRIIIFGCVQTGISSGIVVIDTRNNNEFSIPNISNQGPPSDLADFTATLIGTYILIAFGHINTTNEFSSDIYLLDISKSDKFTWTTSFDPNISTSTNPTNTTSSDSSDGSKVNGGLIAGVIIGIGVLIAIVSCLLYKRSKYMDSVRGRYMKKKFGFSRSGNEQQNTFVIPYQETSMSSHQDTYTNNFTPRHSGEGGGGGGGSSEMNDTTARNMSQPQYNSNLYDAYSGEASGRLTRSSSVYSHATDFDEGHERREGT